MARYLNGYRRFDGRNQYAGGHDNSGLHDIRKATLEAELGSASLRKATQKLFRKWERENNMREGAGEILVPAGWRGRR